MTEFCLFGHHLPSQLHLTSTGLVCYFPSDSSPALSHTELGEFTNSKEKLFYWCKRNEREQPKGQVLAGVEKHFTRD